MTRFPPPPGTAPTSPLPTPRLSYFQTTPLVRYHGIRMKSVHLFGKKLSPLPTEKGSSVLLKTVAWVSAGLGAVALGLFVGRELRQRYKFNRKTPYDVYAHAGDQIQDMECGVGI